MKFREEGGKNNGRGGDQSSLVAQWLRLHASRAQGTGSIPGQGTKISQVHDSAKEREREEAEGETESSEALIKNEGLPRAGVRVLLGPLVLVSSHPFILYFLFFPNTCKCLLCSSRCSCAFPCFIHFILDAAVAEMQAV